MERFLLVLALVAVCLLAGAGLRLGWRRRLTAQRSRFPLGDPPAPPADLGADLVTPLSGQYISTTPTGRWQERLLESGLGRRGQAVARLTAAGVLIDRVAEQALFLPVTSLVGLGTAPGIAGKVMGTPEGVVVMTWKLGDVVVDTGFRADDLDAQRHWLAAGRTMLADSGAPA